MKLFILNVADDSFFLMKFYQALQSALGLRHCVPLEMLAEGASQKSSILLVWGVS